MTDADSFIVLFVCTCGRACVCACVRQTTQSAGMEIRIHDLMCEESSRGCVAPNVADIQELYRTRQARASL